VGRFRISLGKIRLYYYVRVRNQLRTLESDDSIAEALTHNLKSLGGFGGRRMRRLIKAIAAIETISLNEQLLILGPRNENDLLIAAAEGFKWTNIVGCDLISYSPKINLGDLHALPYSDNSFDVVICGWTLSYSDNPMKAASEILRVVKPGGLVGIGIEYSNLSDDEYRELLGYSLAGVGRRLNSVDDLKTLFYDSMRNSYFTHDAPLKRSHNARSKIEGASSIMLVFDTKQP